MPPQAHLVMPSTPATAERKEREYQNRCRTLRKMTSAEARAMDLTRFQAPARNRYPALPPGREWEEQRREKLERVCPADEAFHITQRPAPRWDGKRDCSRRSYTIPFSWRLGDVRVVLIFLRNGRTFFRPFGVRTLTLVVMRFSAGAKVSRETEGDAGGTEASCRFHPELAIYLCGNDNSPEAEGPGEPGTCSIVTTGETRWWPIIPVAVERDVPFQVTRSLT